MKRIKGKQNINTLEFWNRFYARVEILKKGNDRLIYYKEIESFINPNAKIICELGCGEGIGLNYLKQKFPNILMQGFDYSISATSFASRNYACKYLNLSFFCEDILEISLPEYSQIIIIETLEHLEKPKELIDKCLGKCEELIITVPHAYKCCEELSHIITGFKRKSFRGYKVLHYSTFRNDRNLLVKLKGNL